MEDWGYYLPDPEWGVAATPLKFNSMEELESTLRFLKRLLHRELKAHHYNNVESYLYLYNDFKKQSRSFYQFFKDYQPLVLSESMSCVGLSFSLLEQIAKLRPDLKPFTFLASCEEMTKFTLEDFYVMPDQEDYKEHVMVGLKIEVEGRKGVVLLDPGYHITFPIVVMADGQTPDNGRFSIGGKVKKEYEYTLTGNCNYVNWTTTKTKNGEKSSWQSYVYVGKTFLSAVPIVEKKNLVYNLRSLIARDEEGPKSGFYCNLGGKNELVLFYRNEKGQQEECRIPYSYFDEASSETKEFEKSIVQCASQSGYNHAYFVSMFKAIIVSYQDQSFMPHLLKVNKILEED